jgi:hypothetical protein
MRIIAFICALTLLSCNPVKQVLKDKNKLDKVAEEVIRKGYCITESTVVVQDSIVYRDSVVEFKVPCPIDTTLGDDGTQINIRSGVLTAKVKAKETHKIIKETVRDRSYENLLKADISQRDSAIKAYVEIVSKEQAKVAAAKKEALSWKFRLWMLVAVLVIYKLRRPILRAISGI